VKTLSSSTPRQQPKKSWDEAMKGYDFSGVYIPVDHHKAEPAKSSSKPASIKNLFKSTAPVNVRIKPDKAKPERKAKPEKAADAPRPTRKPLRYLATRSLFLVCGLATLGNVPVYSMINTSKDGQIINLTDPLLDGSSPAQIIKDLNLPAVAVESFSGYAMDVLPDATQGNWSMHTISADDTLETIFSSLELTKTSQKLLEDSAIKQALNHLKTDSRLFTQVVDGSLQQLLYAKSKGETYVVSVTDDGYVGKWDTNALDNSNAKIAFTIKHSINSDGKTAGLSKSLIRQLSQIFQKDIDINKSARVGDKIGMVFENFVYQGESIYTDKVLAAEYTTNKQTYQRVRFTLAEGRTDYFRPDGDTELKRPAFDRKPLTDGRLSSGFGMRNHPVFFLRKNHTGTDFAAPLGTPIHATADGFVKLMERQGGYGNLVELRHDGNITTRYGHMSAFNEDFKPGSPVKRGDVIGYVGSTGTSTGNHVHYEFRVNGEPQNPMAVEIPQVGIMSAEEMQAFKNRASAMVQELADLRKVAATQTPQSTPSG
jgi:murein DD-endopeptidase MepM/ murein hydrolase activator NlpD